MSGRQSFVSGYARVCQASPLYGGIGVVLRVLAAGRLSFTKKKETRNLDEEPRILLLVEKSFSTRLWKAALVLSTGCSTSWSYFLENWLQCAWTSKSWRSSSCHVHWPDSGNRETASGACALDGGKTSPLFRAGEGRSRRWWRLGAKVLNKLVEQFKKSRKIQSLRDTRQSVSHSRTRIGDTQRNGGVLVICELRPLCSRRRASSVPDAFNNTFSWTEKSSPPSCGACA